MANMVDIKKFLMVEVKKFFKEDPNGRKCTARELKVLPPKTRTELKALLNGNDS